MLGGVDASEAPLLRSRGIPRTFQVGRDDSDPSLRSCFAVRTIYCARDDRTLFDMTKKFYITTPIYYVNARPHIGHAYTTIACDTVARRQRMMGFDTYFLTGTDEHGQKIERAAQAAGKTPQQLTDEVSAQFRGLWDRMGLTYDDFIRTTSDRHKQGVQTLWRRIRDNGFIYKGHYTGQSSTNSTSIRLDPGHPVQNAAAQQKLCGKKITSSSSRRFRTG